MSYEDADRKRPRSPAREERGDYHKRTRDGHEDDSFAMRGDRGDRGGRRGRFAEQEKNESDSLQSDRQFRDNRSFRETREPRDRDNREEVFRNFNRRDRGGRGGRGGDRDGFRGGDRDGFRGGDRDSFRGGREGNEGDLRGVIRGTREDRPFVDPGDRWGAPRSALTEERSFRGRGPRGGMRSGGRGAGAPEPRDTTYDYVIPRSDRYFDHDDRGEMPIRKGGRGGRGGSFRRDFRRESDREWRHDKFEGEGGVEEGEVNTNDRGGEDRKEDRREDEGRRDRDKEDEERVKSTQEEMNDREEFEEAGDDSLL